MVNFIYVLFAILLTTPLMGGDVSSRVNLTEGTMDDEFILSVEVEGSAVSTPQVPDSYQGIEFRSMGRSSSYSNINGVSKNLVTYNYKMDFEKPGSYTVPSIFVKVDSALRKSMPLRVKVLAPTNAVAGSSNTQSAPIYIERTLDKKEVYLGGYLVSKVKIFARIPLRTSGYEYVTTPGFQIKEIKGARSSSKVIKGQTYKIYEVSAILTPSKVGKFTVKPYKLSVVMPQQRKKKRRRGDPFDDFFDDHMMQDFFGRRRSQKVISSNQIEVTVLDLPKSNQPTDFSGVVGNVKVNVKAPKGKLQTGENVNLDVELFGDVRLDGISLEGVNLNPSFKVYPSEGSGEDNYHHDGIRGKRVFSYGIVPTQPGKIDMGSVEVSYFDPSTKSYKRIKKALGSFDITGKNLSDTPANFSNVADKNAPVVTPKTPQDFKKLSQLELDKIQTKPGSWSGLRGWLPYVAFGFPLFIFILFGANYWGPTLRRKFFQNSSSSLTWKKFDEQWTQAKKSQEPQRFYQLATQFLSDSSDANIETKNHFEIQKYLGEIGFQSSEDLVHQLKRLDKSLYGQGAKESLRSITSGLYAELKKLSDHCEKES